MSLKHPFYSIKEVIFLNAILFNVLAESNGAVLHPYAKFICVLFNACPLPNRSPAELYSYGLEYR